MSRACRPAHDHGHNATHTIHVCAKRDSPRSVEACAEGKKIKRTEISTFRVGVQPAVRIRDREGSGLVADSDGLCGGGDSLLCRGIVGEASWRGCLEVNETMTFELFFTRYRGLWCEFCTWMKVTLLPIRMVLGVKYRKCAGK